MEAVPFLGSVQIRVVQGSLSVLGFTLRASGDQWHEMHSPAGGLPIVLQTASAVSASTVVLMRRIDRLRRLPVAEPPDKTAAVMEEDAETAVTEMETEAAEPDDAEAGADGEAGADEAGADEAEAEADEDDDQQLVDEEDDVEPEQMAQLAAAGGDVPLPLLVSEALAATTSDDSTRVDGLELEPETHVATAAAVPPPPPRSKPLQPLLSEEEAHAAKSLRLMARHLQLRPLPLVAEAGRAWLPAEWEAAADELVTSMWAGWRGDGDGDAEGGDDCGGGDSGAGLGSGVGARAPSLLLCGARNVGKSSFGRYLLNRALSDAPAGGAVCYLECDVGQSELSPPGLVSLHVVSAPLLGPPHTHVRAAAVTCCVGDASPATAPQHYVRCVQHVLAAYRARHASLPLLVNTCGYVSGLGAQLLADLIDSTQPDALVFLDRPPPPPREHGAREARDGHDSEVAALVAGCGAPRLLRLPPLYAASAGDGSAPLPSAPTAADVRTMQLLAYFGALPTATHLLPGGPEGYTSDAAWQQALCSFVARPPYMVPRSAVHLCAMHSAVAPTELMRALNASLVGLGHLPADTAVANGTSNSSGATVLREAPVCECVGYAVVRSVDEERGLLYLATPEPPERLVHVNVLLRGALELPLAMLLPTTLTAASPYLTTDALKGAGSAAQKSRNNLVRQTG